MRHRDAHLPVAARQEAAEAHAAAEGTRGASLLDEASSLHGRVSAILDKAEASGNFTTAIQAAREIARLIELRGRLTHEIDTSATVNITYAPVMIELQTIVMQALAPFDDDKRAVVAALTRLSGGGGGSAPRTIEYDPAG